MAEMPTNHWEAGALAGWAGLSQGVLAQHLVHPGVVVLVCVIAGIGTIMLLPAHREAPIVKLGGVIAAAAGLVLAALLARVGAGVIAYFWIFAAIALFSALRLITHTKPVYSALYFVLSVLSTAGLFVLLWAEFMAAALVLVYAGAILVTYVFVIMLAAQVHVGAGEATGGTEYDLRAREPIAATAVGFTIMALLLFVIFEQVEGQVARGPDPSALYSIGLGGFTPAGTTQMLGLYLFENHMVSVQMAAILLTVGLVGAIVVARRRVPREVIPEADPDVVVGPSTPTSDDPHSIPVIGTDNPRQKEYPER
jgi:NADH-quinone oxidoreductase subunit J